LSPLAVLPTPVVLKRSALTPLAVLELPVVLLKSALIFKQRNVILRAADDRRRDKETT
jgi:hypothetical protein